MHPTLNRPTPYSYWVIPGKLLAGAHPDAMVAESAKYILQEFLKAKVGVFIDLTEVYNNYTEIILEEAAILELSVEYLHLPIDDMSIPTPEQMTHILDIIDSSIEAGKAVYVHCFAGLGRTGTVVGCYLVRHGLSGKQALLEIARLRRGTVGERVISPGTKAQREMVLNWAVGK